MVGYVHEEKTILGATGVHKVDVSQFWTRGVGEPPAGVLGRDVALGSEYGAGKHLLGSMKIERCVGKPLTGILGDVVAFRRL